MNSGGDHQTTARVLVAEKIGESGIGLLREHFEVDLGTGWTREELSERIGEYDGILIRSATNLDARELRSLPRPALERPMGLGQVPRQRQEHRHRVLGGGDHV